MFATTALSTPLPPVGRPRRPPCAPRRFCPKGCNLHDSKVLREWGDELRIEHSLRKDKARKAMDYVRTTGRSDLDSVIRLHKNALMEVNAFFDGDSGETSWSRKKPTCRDDGAAPQADVVEVDIFDPIVDDEPEDDER